MKHPKYIYEHFNGHLVYPKCPEQIKSKEDLQRWFEHRGQVGGNDKAVNDRKHLLKHLASKFIKKHTNIEIEIMFPRCKFSASANFREGDYQNECYSISL